MKKLIKDTNPYLKDPKERQARILKSALASAKLEGINISEEKAKKIYKEILKKTK